MYKLVMFFHQIPTHTCNMYPQFADTWSHFELRNWNAVNHDSMSMK